MRVRRASDSVEADVGFDASNELSLTSPISNTSDAQSYTDLADFVDHTGTSTSAFVRTWYDQAASNNAEQTTSTSQPKVYDSSTGLVTQNGKPAVDFNGTSDSFTSIAKAASTPAETMSVVITLDSALGDYRIIAHPTSSGATGSPRFKTSSNTFQYQDYSPSPTTFTTATIATDTNQNLIFGFVSDTSKTAKIFKNNVNGTDGTTITGSLLLLGSAETDIKMGRQRNSESRHLDGRIQEYVRWDTDRESDRSGIQTNVNSVFSIY